MDLRARLRLGSCFYPGTNGIGGESGPGVLQPPADFAWSGAIPITFYDDGTTSFNKDDWKVAATASLYVNQATGNNANPGTLAQPYRDINYAITRAALLPDTEINIFVAAGVYPYNRQFSAQQADKSMNFIATGGRVTCTNKFALTSWTLDGTGTYWAARTTIGNVTDAKFPVAWPDGAMLPMIETKRADVAGCQANPGSMYTNNVNVWVHTTDGRIPDAGAGGQVACLFNAPGMTMGYTRQCYVEGFDFIGCTPNCITIADANMGAGARLVIVDCTFQVQNMSLGKSVANTGLTLLIASGCRVYGGLGDCYNDHVGPNNGIQPQSIFLDCHGYNPGTPDSDDSYNVFTTHDVGRSIRHGCSGLGSIGPVWADVNSSQSWNILCDIGASAAGSADSQDSSVQALNSTKVWLDGCVIQPGSHYSAYAGTGAQIRYTNMTMPGLTSGDVAPY